MKSAPELRQEFVATVAHIRSAVAKVRTNSGPGRVLTPPDSHKISEGLFLSVVTHWEEFTQALLISDLALLPSSALVREVRRFKSGAARDRLAELVTAHLDHPQGFYDWSDFAKVHTRSLTLLGPTNRFNVIVPPVPPAIQPTHRASLPPPTLAELIEYKIIRNAVAHKTDKARDAFLRLVKRAPYNLLAGQTRGITPGRFVIAHNVGGVVILDRALNTYENAALLLTP
jgi:hypothetical protein